jgi:hypothetical protein
MMNLAATIHGSLVHVCKQRELSLRRERRFRFVEQIQAFTDALLKQRQERFPVGARKQRTAAITRVGVADEIRILVPLVQ